MKNILTAIFATAALTTFAQVEDPNVMVIHYTDGSTKQINITDADYMEFLKVENPDEGDTPEIPDVPVADPKVGDYYYSDGTWSDGGLISIDSDGQNAVWADPKPAPIVGKTVIGIVFNTDPERFAESEKAAGYTHGYVIACKNITDPGKRNFEQYYESVWFATDWGVTDVNQVAKTAKSCYENLDGYDHTWNLIANNEAEHLATDIPMFFYGTDPNFHVMAPANTTGWFIPSSGQMWDCVANFCNGEVAAFLAEHRADTSDFTYYCTKKDLSVSPLEQFLKPFELVPDEDKDGMTIPDNGFIRNKTAYIELGTSTRYDTESRIVFNLGMDGYTYFEGMCGWFDEESHARPILAF